MPPGPHMPSIELIRRSLEQVPDAIRHDDPSTDPRGAGSDPAIAVRVSDPDRQDDPRSLMVSHPTLGRPELDTDSSDSVIDEPAVIFEIPPQVTEAEVRGALGDEMAQIEQLSQIQGIDAYGWYVTFHQRRFQHGVHIPFEGILAFAMHAFAGIDLSFERKVELAFHAILRHELFHFNVDCMTANWELTTGAAVFWNAKERNRNPNGYVPLEEALANAYMLRGFKHPSRTLSNSAGAYQALKRFCLRQPEGYRDAARYVKTRGPCGRMDSYFDACSTLTVTYQQSSQPVWSPLEQALDTLMFYPDLIRIDWTRCPIIILDQHNLQRALGIGISYFQSITDIEPTPAFNRSLKKLDRSIQRQWQDTVDKLASSTALKSVGFQRWEKDGPDYYSVKVNSNFRAHLRLDRSTHTWFAESIGDHKKMRHG